MSSILKVDTIQDASGGNEIKPSGLAPEIDMYRLTAVHNTAGDGILTAWERVDDASFTKVGTGMSVSSGIFTFPKTGVYKVTMFSGIQNNSGDTGTNLVAEISSDSGSNFDETIFLTVQGDTSNYRQATVSGVGIVNVTNTSTFRFRAVGKSFSSGSSIPGHTNKTRTGILFERIADAQ